MPTADALDAVGRRGSTPSVRRCAAAPGPEPVPGAVAAPRGDRRRRTSSARRSSGGRDDRVPSQPPRCASRLRGRFADRRLARRRGVHRRGRRRPVAARGRRRGSETTPDAELVVVSAERCPRVRSIRSSAAVSGTVRFVAGAPLRGTELTVLRVGRRTSASASSARSTTCSPIPTCSPTRPATSSCRSGARSSSRSSSAATELRRVDRTTSTRPEMFARAVGDDRDADARRGRRRCERRSAELDEEIKVLLLPRIRTTSATSSSRSAGPRAARRRTCSPATCSRCTAPSPLAQGWSFEVDVGRAVRPGWLLRGHVPRRRRRASGPA